MHKKLWNKDFVLMLQGGAFSTLGEILYSVAIGYWVYEKTGSSSLMGVMSSISMFMQMIVMPFSGTVIDRCNRKNVIVAMDALRGLLMLAVGALAFAEKLSVEIVLTVSFLSSVCTVFFDPAVSTVILDIIPHEDMVRGQSVQNGVRGLLNLAGKAASGALIVAAGVPLVVVLNGISYLISAVTEVFITVPRTAGQGDKVTVKGIFSDFRVAMVEIFRNPYLRIFVPGSLILNILASGPMSLMLPFATEKGFSVELYGYLMTVMTAGSLACVLLLGIVKLNPTHRYVLMSIGYLSFLGIIIAVYLAADFMVIAVLLFMATFLNTLGNGIFNAALMLALPEEKRGALLGLIIAASSGGSAISVLVYGFLCDRFPIPLVFTAGALLAVLPMVWLCFHRKTKDFVFSH